MVFIQDKDKNSNANDKIYMERTISTLCSGLIFHV